MAGPPPWREIIPTVTCAPAHTPAARPERPGDRRHGLAASTGRSASSRIRAIAPVSRTITVEAGVVLSDVQEAAADAGRLFPLSWVRRAAAPSAAIWRPTPVAPASSGTGRRATSRWGWRSCCPTAGCGTSSGACARTAPALTSSSCSSGPRPPCRADEPGQGAAELTAAGRGAKVAILALRAVRGAAVSLRSPRCRAVPGTAPWTRSGAGPGRRASREDC